ncbi:MAG: hypothetical protein ABIW84_07335, partial [Ilumatobacteraceae bacterium]
RLALDFWLSGIVQFEPERSTTRFVPILARAGAFARSGGTFAGMTEPDDDRRSRAARALELMRAGAGEAEACRQAGIKRRHYRAAVLGDAAVAPDVYTAAITALAHDQVERIERVIADMRAGRVSPMCARVELENRRWLASRFAPKLYGDKVAHVASDGGSLIPPRIVIEVVSVARDMPMLTVDAKTVD